MKGRRRSFGSRRRFLLVVLARLWRRRWRSGDNRHRRRRDRRRRDGKDRARRRQRGHGPAELAAHEGLPMLRQGLDLPRLGLAYLLDAVGDGQDVFCAFRGEGNGITEVLDAGRAAAAAAEGVHVPGRWHVKAN